MREWLGGALNGLRSWPPAHAAEHFLQNELNRALRLPESGQMNAQNARRLADHLHGMLGTLITVCRTEQNRIDTGKGVLGLNRHVPHTNEIDAAVVGLFSTTFQYQQDLTEHLKLAKRYGSTVAQSLLAQNATPPVMPPGMVSMSQIKLSDEQRREIAESIRGIYKQALIDAIATQQDLAPSRTMNALAYHNAQMRAIRLGNWLIVQCTNLARTFIPDLAAPTLIGASGIPGPNTNPMLSTGPGAAGPANGAGSAAPGMSSPDASGTHGTSSYQHPELIITGPRPTVHPSAPEIAQFSAYVRHELPVEQLCPLYAYAYGTSAFAAIQADTQADPYRQQLGEQPVWAIAQAGIQIPMNGELIFVPTCSGVHFSPVRAMVQWEKSWQRIFFSLRAERALAGTSQRGEISIFGGEDGTLVVARIQLVLRFAGGIGR